MKNLIQSELLKEGFKNVNVAVVETFVNFVIFDNANIRYTFDLTKTNKIKKNSLRLCH